MARKLQDQPLEFLYGQTIISSTSEKAIRSKEDFSTIKSEYCTKVCKFNCKDSGKANLVTEVKGTTDLVIIQDHPSTPDKWKDGRVLERNNYNVLKFLVDKHLPGCRWMVLNSLKCTPTGVSQKVKDADIQRCSPYLRSELARIAPRVILCTGTSSSKAIGLGKSVYTCRGEIHNSEFGPVVLTMHPKSLMMLRQNASGAMWGPDYLSCLELDLIKARDIVSGFKVPNFDLEGSIAKAKREDIFFCRNNDDVLNIVTKLLGFPHSKVISFDTETTGLDPWAPDAKLLCIQFGWIENSKEKAAVVPLWHRENKTIDPEFAWSEVSKVLLSEIPKVAHHGKFDVKYIFVTKGIRVVNMKFDTMLLLHELNSGIQGNYGLKRAAWDYMWDTGIAGYEDLLPSLSKEKEIEEDDVGAEETE